MSSQPAGSGQSLWWPLPCHSLSCCSHCERPQGKGTLTPGAAAWGSMARLLLVLNFLFCLLPVRF